MLLHCNIKSQNLGSCGTLNDTISTRTQLSSCTSTSDTWLNKYRTPDYWIPNENTPIKTILVNWVICQKDDGTGGWVDSPEFRAQVDLMFSHINNWYTNPLPKGYSLTCEPPINYLTDTRIRFELNEIIFIRNTSFYYSVNEVTPIFDYLENYHPDYKRAMNHIFTMPTNSTGVWGFYDIDYKYNQSYVKTWRSMWLDWLVVWDDHIYHIAHEYGHAVGLNHTYNTEYTQISHYDFLDDVFGECAEINYCNPVPPITEVCYLEGEFFETQTQPYPIMSGFNNSRYISPKSAGRMHRNLSCFENYFNINNTPMNQYVKEDHSFQIPLSITNNETWDFAMKLYQDIVIEPGKTLIIKCLLKMPINGKIIIKPSGKLIVDGGIITSAHSSPWQGIEVWGNKYAHQFPGSNGSYYQGYLELKNGATIENAVTAVELWKPNDWATTGGIVVANGAIFRNNACSVHALDYRNFMPNAPVAEVDNVSQFTNCSFEITPDYPGDVTFYKHIDLSKVKGVKFKGCDFSLSPNVTGVSEWNQAIASYNAGFSVDAVITSQQPNIIYDNSTFNGFYSGIYATTSQVSTNSFYVNRADFTDNSYGLKALNVHNFTIINSNFNIGCNNSTESAICTGVPGYGIHLDNSSGFAIEENHFTKAANAPSANYYGIYVKNTHSQDIIYKNYFNGLSNGNYAEQVNYGYYPYLGLKYFCNSNENNYSDFYVQKDDPSGIQSGQGSTTYSASNTFSNNATWHFYNGGNNLIDYYYSTINCTDCDPNVSKLYRVTKHLTNQSNSCASHYGSSSSNMVILSENQKAERELLFADALTDYAGVKSLYDNLKDGGSTASTLTDIQSAQPQEMWSLRSKLLGDSPHLSVDVLKQVANKTDVFTEAAIFDILAANPDELKNEELLKYLEEKDSPLPEYMIDILRQVATGITYKSVLQQEMARYEQIRTLAANDMIRSIINDSVTDLVQLRNWLDNKGGIESDKQIVATYAEEGNFEAAFTLANILPTLYNLQGEELQEHANYIQLLDLEFNLMSQNRHIVALDSTELAVLNTFADSSKQASGAASKGILETYYGNHYCNCPEIVSEASYKNTYVDPNSINKIYGLEINAKPNPAKDWAAFDYTLPENATNASLIITDELGKTIETFILLGQQGQQLWDTRSIGVGNYIYTLKVDGYNASGKIVISK